MKNKFENNTPVLSYAVDFVLWMLHFTFFSYFFEQLFSYNDVNNQNKKIRGEIISDLLSGYPFLII